MSERFDALLKNVAGKVHRINFARDYTRYRDGLGYYANIAEELNKAALLVHTHDRTIPHVFAMLAGMSLEALLKGILTGLHLSYKKNHDLSDLCQQAGISISGDEETILDSFSEYVIWAGRYPVPLTEAQLVKAQSIFAKQRRSSGSLADREISETAASCENYMRLWARLLDYEFRVSSSVYQSVELDFGVDDPG